MGKIRLVIRAVGWYCSFMHTLTIKIPPQLEAEILQASAQDHLSKSELVRRALDFYLRQRKSAPPPSFRRWTRQATWSAAFREGRPICLPTPSIWLRLGVIDACI